MTRVNPQELGTVEFTVRGEISRESLEFVLRQIGRQGLSTDIVSKVWYDSDPQDEVESVLPALDDITSIEDYLVREHISEFRERFTPGITETRARLLFGALGGSSLKKYRTRPDPSPEELGLVVKDRRSVGMPRPRAPQELDAAVEVGSLLNFAAKIRGGEHFGLRGFYGPTKDLFLLLTTRIEDQIEAADQSE